MNQGGGDDDDDDDDNDGGGGSDDGGGGDDDDFIICVFTFLRGPHANNRNRFSPLVAQYSAACGFRV